MTRLERFESFCRTHPFYVQYLNRISHCDVEFIVNFLKNCEHLNDDQFTLKANRLFVNDKNRSKNHAIITDLILASRK